VELPDRAATPTAAAAAIAPATTATATPVPAPAAAASVPVTQPALEAALTTVRSRPSGIHELTVQLHPADLGAVRIVAVLSGDRLDVTVLCADHSAQQAVAAAVPALHDRLAELRSLDITGAANSAAGSSADSSPRHSQGGADPRPARLTDHPVDRQESAISVVSSGRPIHRPSGDARFDRRV
jgi:hypothetical protein